jgi:hypothetical protein
MYGVTVGYYQEQALGGTYDSVLDAMDFADILVLKHGFEIARVVDERDSIEYTVEDRTPRTPEEHAARDKLSEDFLIAYQREKMTNA